jgi:hypothetical protein
VVVLPASVLPPGLAVNVHEPAGKPLNATDPVAVAQVVWVIVPIAGAVGGFSTVIVVDDAQPLREV